MTEQEYLVIPQTIHLRSKLTLSRFESRFVRGLMEGKLLATRCPKCGRAMIPPRLFCGLCDTKVEEEMVEQGDKGKLINVIKVEMEQIDAETGQIKQFPYPIGSVELDGGARMDGFIGEQDVSKLRPGMRLEAVWRPKKERRGRFSDIMYFKVID